jgi:hypothetical protein
MRKLDAFLAVAVSVLASSGSAHAQDALAALGGAMPTERSRSSVTVVPLDRPAPAGEGATVTDAPPSGEVASDSLSALSGRLDTLDRAVSDVDLKVKDIDERLGRIEENRVKFDEIRKNQENTANALAGLLSQIDTLERRTRYAVRRDGFRPRPRFCVLFPSPRSSGLRRLLRPDPGLLLRPRAFVRRPAPGPSRPDPDRPVRGPVPDPCPPLAPAPAVRTGGPEGGGRASSGVRVIAGGFGPRRGPSLVLTLPRVPPEILP